MSTKTKTGLSKAAKPTKSALKPAKPTKPVKPAAVTEDVQEREPVKKEKAKKRKLVEEAEPVDAGVEKKRRKSVDGAGKAGKGEKAVEKVVEKVVKEKVVEKGEKKSAEKERKKGVKFAKPGKSEGKTAKTADEAKPVKTGKKIAISEGGGKAKGSKKAPAPEPEEMDEDEPENGVEDGAAEDEAEGVELHGFSSGEDSSDDDDDGVDHAPIDVGKLPTIAKDDATVKRRLEKAKKQKTEERGVLYLGRIPHGFYEDQMRSYFSQFGTVTRLRLSRNKKTGRSKHYAFIEFDSLPVAEIVADTMDNYLMFGHLLQCRLVPQDQVHPELWVGANRKYRAVPKQRMARLRHNRERTGEEMERSKERVLKKQEEKKLKLKEMGIDYDMDAAGFKA